LSLRQNLAPGVHAIQRPIIPPRSNDFALLSGSACSEALRLGRGCGIVIACAHGGDRSRSGRAEARGRGSLGLFAPTVKALIAE
jgi:hypothetical protein